MSLAEARLTDGAADPSSLGLYRASKFWLMV
jgi:hypothetical protein